MNLRAEVYALLAETLAEPPDWMSLPGREWPLFETLTALASESEAANHHLNLMAGIPSEKPDQRCKRYNAIFTSGRPRFWLYESAAKTGKILGPQTFEMARLYSVAGLEASGAELPDHISLELAFLSHLIEQESISAFEQQFLEKHSGWMIELGQALKQSGNPVYAPIGALLADWLIEQMTPRTQPVTLKHDVLRNTLLPGIPRADNCTLCGFCAQVCPTRALKMLEDCQETILALTPAECIHCGKCETICDFKALTMLPTPTDEVNLTLHRSPLVPCQKCGRPIVSQAEMNYIVSQIGEASWQHLCLDCRATLYI